MFFVDCPLVCWPCAWFPLLPAVILVKTFFFKRRALNVFVIKCNWILVQSLELFWLFWPGKIVYLPLPGDDPKQRRPNITRAQKLLDWEPKAMKEGKNSDEFGYFEFQLYFSVHDHSDGEWKVELREGLQKTIEYFKAGLQCESKGRSGDWCV